MAGPNMNVFSCIFILIRLQRLCFHCKSYVVLQLLACDSDVFAFNLAQLRFLSIINSLLFFSSSHCIYLKLSVYKVMTLSNYVSVGFRIPFHRSILERTTREGKTHRDMVICS